MQSDPDIELIRRAKKGDKKSFGILVNRYYKMVYAVAYGVLNHREKALDVAQDVFLKAYEMLNTFEERSKWTTWIYRITVNRAIDLGRKKGARESLDAGITSDPDAPSKYEILPSQQSGPREEAAQSELRERMQQALQKMTEDQRAVLVLREWHGLTYEEIAKTLDIEAGTVMSRLFYARKKFGEILKELGCDV